MALEWAALWSGLKGLATAARDAGKLELYEKALDLQQQVQELYDENRALSRRVDELTQQLEFGSQLRYERNAYWRGNGYGEDSGPFCPKCYDDDRKGIRMTRITDGHARCPKCTGYVVLQVLDHIERPPQQNRQDVEWG